MITGAVIVGISVIISSLLFAIIRKKRHLDLDKFIFSPDKLKIICSALVTEFETRLSSPSTTIMLSTFIDKFPKGTEEGEFLAMDVGGTNMRIALIYLHKYNQPKFVNYYSKLIPEEYKKGSGYSLFRFFAIELIGFVQNLNRVFKFMFFIF